MIHGIAEKKEKNVDKQATDFINGNLDIEIDDIMLKDRGKEMTRERKK